MATAAKRGARHGVQRSLNHGNGSPVQSLPNYKPVSLRLPFLACVAVYLCILLAILEFGFRKLPVTSDGGRGQHPQDNLTVPYVSGPLISARQTLASALSPSTTHAAARWPKESPDIGNRPRESRRWTFVNSTALSTGQETTPTTAQGPASSLLSYFNQTTQLTFANMSGSLWQGAQAGGNYTLSNSTKQRRNKRELDPSHYGRPEASLRQVFMYFHPTWLRQGATLQPLGQSIIRFHQWDSDPNKDESPGDVYYPVACDGPALIFLTTEGWAWFTQLGVIERDWKAEGHDWRPLNVDDGASQCRMDEPIYETGTPTAGLAQVIVVTDAAGLPLSTVTKVFTDLATTWSEEILTDSQGRPTSTIAHNSQYERRPTTLLDSAGRPTATTFIDVPFEPSRTTLTDSNGIATATVGLVTFSDSNGVPTATEILELDSNGRPTATDELDLVTLKDSSGHPTATVVFEVATLRDSNGTPTATMEMEILTLRDASGTPTATITSVLGRVTAQSGRIVLTDSNGIPAATIEDNPHRPSLYPEVVTLTDAKGNPTATVTGFRAYTTSLAGPTTTASPTQCQGLAGDAFGCLKAQILHPITQSEYMSAYFLPVLFGLVASVMIQVINSDLKTFLPFHALVRPGGAAALDSLGMKVGGIDGLKTSWKLLWRFRDPVSFLSDILLALSALVVALSSEAFGVKLKGSCSPDDFTGCFMGLTLYSGPGRAVEVLLIVMLLLIILLSIFSSRWCTGVAAPPTSLAALSSMLQEKTCIDIFRDIKLGTSMRRQHLQNLGSELKDFQFCLGYYPDFRGISRYGIIAQRAASQPAGITRSRPANAHNASSTSSTQRLIPGILGNIKPGYRTAISTVHLGIRGAFLLIISGFLALILYYKSTRLDTSFEHFMDSQSFGVRILFTSMGIIISFFWQHQLSWVTRMEPFRRLSRRPQLARVSILVPTPTTDFGAFALAIMRWEPVTALVAAASILSKVTPILLANIPFSPVQTWDLHVVCTWVTVAILAYMILVLLVQFATKYPYMPFSPDVAGRLYYLADSPIPVDFQDASMLSQRDLVRQANKKTKYCFGKMLGVSGEIRIGISHAPEARFWKSG